MRDIYATTLQLVDIAGGDAFEVACDRALGWAWRIDGERPDLRERPAGRLPENAGPDETALEWWSALEGPARALELRLRHPDMQESELQWLATITLSDIEGGTRATIRLERGASVHVLRPWKLDLRPPAIVMDLMRPPLLAYAGSLELTPGARMLEASAVDSFVADNLKAEGRALPVLIASCSVWPNLVETLAKGLAGLAQVVRVADDEAEEVLGGELQKSGYVVPRGGLRLYWPGFGLASQPRRHPYWTAAQVREGRQGGPSVVKQLIKMLAPISTGRVPTDPGVMRARRELLMAGLREQRAREEARRERARREREKAAETLARARADLGASAEVSRLEAQLADTEAELDAVVGERDTALKQAENAAANELKVIDESLGVEQRATMLGERIARLESENAGLRESIKTISTYQAEPDQEADDAVESVPEEVTCWEDVAEFLPELDGPGFTLTDRALECADGKGRYPHPHTMWKELRALERVGRLYNELGAELGMRFDEFASQQGGIEVALQDSSYEDDSFFEFEGEERSRLPHVKIDDAKAANEVGRIYFALDPDQNRLIVDWFGTKPDRPKTRRAGAVP